MGTQAKIQDNNKSSRVASALAALEGILLPIEGLTTPRIMTAISPP